MKSVNYFKYAIVISAVLAFTGCEKAAEQLIESIAGSKNVKAQFAADSPKGTIETVRAMSFDGVNVTTEIVSAPYRESSFQIALVHPADPAIPKPQAFIGLFIMAEGLVQGEDVTVTPDDNSYNSIGARFVGYDENDGKVDTAYCIRKSGDKWTEYEWIYCDSKLTIKSKNLDLKFRVGWNIVAITDDLVFETIDKLPGDARWVFSDEYYSK